MAKYDNYSLLTGKDRTFRKPSSVITATHVKGVDFRPEDLTFFNYLLACSGNIKNPTGVYYVSMKEAMEFMRFDRPAKIHECLERLCSGKIEVDYLDGDGNPRSLRSHYLSSDSSKAETGTIQYAFDQILVHFLIDPKVYGLISANRSNDIKSFSGKRLYEMMALQRHKWDTKWMVSLEEFRALTDTETTNLRWDNYRRNVIEKAVVEVNAVADFEVLFTFMTSGQGGSVTTLEFDVVEKNHARLLQSKMVRSTKRKGSRLPDPDTVDMLDGKTTAERGGPAELTADAVEEAATLIGEGNNLDNFVLEWREKTRGFALNDPDGHFLNFVSLKVKKENDPVLNILDDEIFFNLLNGEDD